MRRETPEERKARENLAAWNAYADFVREVDPNGELPVADRLAMWATAGREAAKKLRAQRAKKGRRRDPEMSAELEAACAAREELDTDGA